MTARMGGEVRLRFGFLVAAVAASGLVVGAAIPYLTAPSQGPTVMANARPQGSDSSSFHFTLADLNPLRLIFDYEMHEIQTNANRDLFPAAPVLKPDFSFVERLQSQSQFDPQEIARWNAEGMETRMREMNLHQQAIMDYMQHPGVGPAPPMP